ncbi:MAG: hypothetical protein NZM37_10550, partial [Sandaracinaceae bacterium]|nr:hypothetical protein [Sandaracinaceae bacterium]MDW8247122.1 hypothetical protein [Sandaracinaceae bacterium]
LIHFGVVHGSPALNISPDGLRPLFGDPPTLSPAQARYLEQLAARAVRRTFEEAHFSQRSSSECATLIMAPCRALYSEGQCRSLPSALANDTAPIPNHSGEWCLR